jgi:hypothetical protein
VLRNLDDPCKFQSVEIAVIAIEDKQFIAASNSNGVGREWARQY